MLAKKSKQKIDSDLLAKSWLRKKCENSITCNINYRIEIGKKTHYPEEARAKKVANKMYFFSSLNLSWGRMSVYCMCTEHVGRLCVILQHIGEFCLYHHQLSRLYLLKFFVVVPLYFSLFAYLLMISVIHSLREFLCLSFARLNLCSYFAVCRVRNFRAMCQPASVICWLEIHLCQCEK